MFKKVYLGDSPIKSIKLGEITIDYNKGGADDPSYPPNTVAVYTANTADTAVYTKTCSASDWTDTAVNNGDGTYTHTITASAMPTALRFQGSSSSSPNTKLLTVEYVNTSNLTTMYYMFRYCTNLTYVNGEGWDTSKVTDMGYMFYNCSKLASLNGLNNWNTSNVTSMNYMFYGCKNLTSVNASGWDVSNVTTMNYMFYGCSNLTNLNISNWDVNTNVTVSYMWTNSAVNQFNIIWNNVSNEDKEKLNVPYPANVVIIYTATTAETNVTSKTCTASDWLDIAIDNGDGTYTHTITASVMPTAIKFKDKTSLLTVEYFDTKNITTGYEMFRGCSNLSKIKFKKDTSDKKLTNMNYAFYGCSSLTSLDLSNFKFVSPSSGSCQFLHTFENCSRLTTLNLQRWKLHSSYIMGDSTTFSGCYALKYVNIKGCNTRATFEMLCKEGKIPLPSRSTSNPGTLYYDSNYYAGSGYYLPTGWQASSGSWPY